MADSPAPASIDKSGSTSVFHSAEKEIAQKKTTENEDQTWLQLGAFKCKKCGIVISDKSLIPFHSCFRKRVVSNPNSLSSEKSSSANKSSALPLAQASCLTQAETGHSQLLSAPSRYSAANDLSCSDNMESSLKESPNIEFSSARRGNILYDKTNDTLTCDVCTYQNKGNVFLEHLMCHMVSAPYTCHHCPGQFPTRSDFMRHCADQHPGLKIRCVLKGIAMAKRVIKEAQNTGCASFDVKYFTTGRQSLEYSVSSIPVSSADEQENLVLPVLASTPASLPAEKVLDSVPTTSSTGLPSTTSTTVIPSTTSSSVSLESSSLCSARTTVHSSSTVASRSNSIVSKSCNPTPSNIASSAVLNESGINTNNGPMIVSYQGHYHDHNAEIGDSARPPPPPHKLQLPRTTEKLVLPSPVSPVTRNTLVSNMPQNSKNASGINTETTRFLRLPPHGHMPSSSLPLNVPTLTSPGIMPHAYFNLPNSVSNQLNPVSFGPNLCFSNTNIPIHNTFQASVNTTSGIFLSPGLVQYTVMPMSQTLETLPQETLQPHSRQIDGRWVVNAPHLQGIHPPGTASILQGPALTPNQNLVQNQNILIENSGVSGQNATHHISPGSVSAAPASTVKQFINTSRDTPHFSNMRLQTPSHSSKASHFINLAQLLQNTNSVPITSTEIGCVPSTCSVVTSHSMSSLNALNLLASQGGSIPDRSNAVSAGGNTESANILSSNTHVMNTSNSDNTSFQIILSDGSCSTLPLIKKEKADPLSSSELGSEGLGVSYVMFKNDFVCLYCRKVFNRESEFYKHVWDHQHPDKVRCSQCALDNSCALTGRTVEATIKRGNLVDSSILKQISNPETREKLLKKCLNIESGTPETVSVVDSTVRANESEDSCTDSGTHDQPSATSGLWGNSANASRERQFISGPEVVNTNSDHLLNDSSVDSSTADSILSSPTPLSLLCANDDPIHRVPGQESVSLTSRELFPVVQEESERDATEASCTSTEANLSVSLEHNIQKVGASSHSLQIKHVEPQKIVAAMQKSPSSATTLYPEVTEVSSKDSEKTSLTKFSDDHYDIGAERIDSVSPPVIAEGIVATSITSHTPAVTEKEPNVNKFGTGSSSCSSTKDMESGFANNFEQTKTQIENSASNKTSGISKGTDDSNELQDVTDSENFDLSEEQESEENNELENPVKIVVSRSRRSTDLPPDRSAMFFKCPLCNYSCHLATDFTVHLNSDHHSEQNFVCLHCNYHGLYTTDLTNHINLHTTGPAQMYLCPSKVAEDDFCPFATDNTAKLHQHIQASHQNCKDCKCRTCDLSFPTPVLLIKHLVENSLTLFSCSRCPARFLVKQAIQQHWECDHVGNQMFRVIRMLLCLDRKLNCYTKLQQNQCEAEDRNRIVATMNEKSPQSSANVSFARLSSPLRMPALISFKSDQNTLANKVEGDQLVTKELRDGVPVTVVNRANNTSHPYAEQQNEVTAASKDVTNSPLQASFLSASPTRLSNVSSAHNTPVLDMPLYSAAPLSQIEQPHILTASMHAPVIDGLNTVQSSGDKATVYIKSEIDLPDFASEFAQDQDEIESSNHQTDGEKMFFPAASINSPVSSNSELACDQTDTKTLKHQAIKASGPVIVETVSLSVPSSDAYEQIQIVYNNEEEEEPLPDDTEQSILSVNNNKDNEDDNYNKEDSNDNEDEDNDYKEEALPNENEKSFLLNSSFADDQMESPAGLVGETSTTMPIILKTFSLNFHARERSDFVANVKEENVETAEAQEYREQISESTPVFSDNVPTLPTSAPRLQKLYSLCGSAELHQALNQSLYFEYSEGYKCSICETVFAKLKDIHFHIFNHYKVPLVACIYCSTGSAHEMFIIRHLTKMHRDQEPSIFQMYADISTLINPFSQSPVSHTFFRQFCQCLNYKVDVYLDTSPWRTSLLSQSLAETQPSDSESETRSCLKFQSENLKQASAVERSYISKKGKSVRNKKVSSSHSSKTNLKSSSKNTSKTTKSHSKLLKTYNRKEKTVSQPASSEVPPSEKSDSVKEALLLDSSVMNDILAPLFTKDCLPNGICAYMCEICKEQRPKFNNRYQMHLHIISHLGIKLIKCPYCPRTEVEVISLKRHILQSHPRNPQKIEPINVDVKAVVENFLKRSFGKNSSKKNTSTTVSSPGSTVQKPSVAETVSVPTPTYPNSNYFSVITSGGMRKLKCKFCNSMALTPSGMNKHLQSCSRFNMSQSVSHHTQAATQLVRERTENASPPGNCTPISDSETAKSEPTKISASASGNNLEKDTAGENVPEVQESAGGRVVECPTVNDSESLISNDVISNTVNSDVIGHTSDSTTSSTPNTAVCSDVSDSLLQSGKRKYDEIQNDLDETPVEEVEQEILMRCKFCTFSVSKSKINELEEHLNKHLHIKKLSKCGHCDFLYGDPVMLRNHYKSKHPDEQEKKAKVPWNLFYKEQKENLQPTCKAETTVQTEQSSSFQESKSLESVSSTEAKPETKTLVQTDTDCYSKNSKSNDSEVCVNTNSSSCTVSEHQENRVKTYSNLVPEFPKETAGEENPSVSSNPHKRKCQENQNIAAGGTVDDPSTNDMAKKARMNESPQQQMDESVQPKTTPAVIVSDNRPDPTVDFRYVCVKCNLKQMNKFSMRAHLAEHLNYRTIKCSHCTAAFFTREDLTRHHGIEHFNKPCNRSVVRSPVVENELSNLLDQCEKKALKCKDSSPAPSNPAPTVPVSNSSSTQLAPESTSALSTQSTADYFPNMQCAECNSFLSCPSRLKNHLYKHSERDEKKQLWRDVKSQNMYNMKGEVVKLGIHPVRHHHLCGYCPRRAIDSDLIVQHQESEHRGKPRWLFLLSTEQNPTAMETDTVQSKVAEPKAPTPKLMEPEVVKSKIGEPEVVKSKATEPKVVEQEVISLKDKSDSENEENVIEMDDVKLQQQATVFVRDIFTLRPDKFRQVLKDNGIMVVNVQLLPLKSLKMEIEDFPS